MAVTDVELFDWDSEIEQDSEFKLLDAGDYDFTIVNFERGQYDGSEKLPACKMATVSFKVGNDKDTVTLTDRFYLCSIMEWKLSQLFKSVGLKEEGKKAKMDWNALPGKSGRCKVIQEKNQSNDNYHNKISTLYAKKKGDGSVWD